MSFKCEIIADSKSLQGDRLTTFVVTFPRIVLAEFNTHRMFSRNSASSRAIPFETMVKRVEEHPFIPIAWQKDHKGMQGTEYLDEKESKGAIQAWLESRDDVVSRAKYLNELGNVTKQLCNRLLEPFMWHTALITATEFENFFALRCPQYQNPVDSVDDPIYFKSRKDYCDFYNVEDKGTDLTWLKHNKGQGEIHISLLAEAMWDAYNESTPKQLKAGEYHIPFGDSFDHEKLSKLEDCLNHTDLYEEDLKIKIATARCARVSYLNYEGKDDYEADIKLFDRLKSMEHYSPFEHVAKAMNEYEYESYQKKRPSKDGIGSFGEKGWCRNFRGFIQLREILC